MNPNYLEFEQPIAELEAKIEELRLVGSGTDVNISEEIRKLEEKNTALTESIFKDLTPWQISQLARHPRRVGDDAVCESEPGAFERPDQPGETASHRTGKGLLPLDAQCQRDVPPGFDEDRLAEESRDDDGEEVSCRAVEEDDILVPAGDHPAHAELIQDEPDGGDEHGPADASVRDLHEFVAVAYLGIGREVGGHECDAGDGAQDVEQTPGGVLAGVGERVRDDTDVGQLSHRHPHSTIPYR